jgi:hypothetical protein
MMIGGMARLYWLLVEEKVPTQVESQRESTETKMTTDSRLALLCGPSKRLLG